VQLAGKADDTHCNGKNDALSYSVTVHASILPAGANQGLILSLSLHCAMHLRPGLMLIFPCIEPHRLTPLVPSLDPTEPLAPGYDADTRIVAILYPK
jgi:hypothetical protein